MSCSTALAFYDIGVGASRHKDEWSDVEQTLFDSFLAFKTQGYLATLPAAALTRQRRDQSESPPLAHRASRSPDAVRAKIQAIAAQSAAVRPKIPGRVSAADLS